jgi:general secretion pathway protein F
VSSAFTDAGLTDTVTQRLLAVGERTGNFDRVLQTIAQRHAGNFTTFIERSTRIVEPLLLLTVALVVGGIVVMMYMPVFDIASSIH